MSFPLIRPELGPIELKPEDIFRDEWAARYAVDSARTWVDPAGYRLSDRLWRAGQSDRQSLDAVLEKGIQSGKSPLQVARDAEAYLHPHLEPRRDPKTFRVLPASQQPKGVVTTFPRQGPGQGAARPRNSGLGSMAARRLARTETSAAHGRATMDAGQAMPLLERIKWLLSRNHPEPDQCDSNAERSSRNCPKGVYFHNEVPLYPDHPNEMCTLAHYVDTADIRTAIPRLREYVRTGELPDRAWGEQAWRENRHIPLFDPLVTPKKRGRPAGSKNKPKEPVAEETPEWVRDVDAIRAQEMKRLAETGRIDEAEVRRAGQIVMKNYERSPLVAKHIDEIDALETRRRALKAQRDDKLGWLNKTVSERTAVYDEIKDLTGRIDKINKELGTNAFGANLKHTLEKVRPMGSTQAHPYAPKGNSGAGRVAMKAPQRLMPKEWWDASIAYDAPQVPKVRRGSYQHGYDVPAGRNFSGQLMPAGHVASKINMSGITPQDIADTATHEFVHRMENLRPGLVEAEKSFWEMRTAGEDWQEMKNLFPGYGYRPGELTKKDRFAQPYSGKQYLKANGYKGDYYEIATMGVEDAFRQEGPPKWLTSDPEYRDFIVGILALL